MELTYKPLKQFRDLIKNIGLLSPETNICFVDEGMSVFALDSAHVSFVSLKVKSESFMKYSCTTPCQLGINMNVFLKILKLGDDKCVLKLLFKNDQSKINISMISESSDGSESRIIEMDMTLIDLDYEELEIPERTPDARFSMQSSEFSGTMKNCLGVSDDIEIIVEKTKVSFLCFQPSIGKLTIVNPDKKFVNIVKAPDQPLSMNFSTKYLQTFSSAQDISPEVEISLFDNQPIEIKYNLLNFKDSFLSYFLAPKKDD